MKEKVVAIKCSSYDKEEVEKAVKKIFFLTGVKPNAFEKILFKPNMLSARLPEEGVTTHPSVLEEAVLYFENCQKIIGDSPANSLKPIPVYWEKCGFKKVADNTGAKLVKFDNSFFVEVSGKNTVKVPVTPLIKDFSLVNISKLKTHGLTILTAAIKNLYGLIPGYHKSVLHSKFVSPIDFSEFIADYYHNIRKYVSFNLVDAVVSMEGKGPSAGKLKLTGYIIGGTNAVAVDMICCRLLGLNVKNVPFLQKYDEKYGLPDVELTGDELVPVKNFSIPGKNKHILTSNKVIKRCLNFAGKFFKILPEIQYEKCKKCYACVQVCPVKAISKELVVDKNKCISCLCCFEVCPYKAIEVKKSFIARLFT
jgi:uncharacterized protein (DUF362 family)/NAD-dependent dihydropyrimidine dehydrogenase PreA subunit